MSKKMLTKVVLAAFLILSGLVGLVAGIGNLGLVIAILAAAAGVLILVYAPAVSFRIGWALAAVYLIALGLSSILDISFSGMGTVMAILALAAGVLLLVRVSRVKGNVGYVLFFAWLILVGLSGLVSLGQLGLVINIAALAAGILLVVNV